MSPSSKDPAPAARKNNRWLTILIGIAIGLVWGTGMWGLTALISGDSGGVGQWAYLAVSTAMIGGGVAAVFGAVGARRRGERIAPRIRRR